MIAALALLAAAVPAAPAAAQQTPTAQAESAPTAQPTTSPIDLLFSPPLPTPVPTIEAPPTPVPTIEAPPTPLPSGEPSPSPAPQAGPPRQAQSEAPSASPSPADGAGPNPANEPTSAPVATTTPAAPPPAELAGPGAIPGDPFCLRCFASPTATRTPTPSVSAEPTASASPTAGLAITVTRTPTASPSPTPTTIIPPPPPISYAGVPIASNTAGWLNDGKLWLAMPHRTQFDASVYAQSNCGPTSLGMILEAYGLKNYPNDALRGEVNRIQGNSDPNQGTSLPAIAAVAQRAGLYPVGLRTRWTVDDARASLKAGRPVIMLTRYADLPGNGGYAGDTNHYIVLSGLSGDQFIYNDSAYPQGRGVGLLIPSETLRRASANANVPGQGVAFALRADGAGLLQPDRLRSGEPEEEEIELADEDDLILAAMAEGALDGLSLAIEDVAAFVPGFVDERQMYPMNALATAIPTPQVQVAAPPAAAPSSSAGFPLGRAAAILGLVMLGAYAPGAVAIIIGHIR